VRHSRAVKPLRCQSATSSPCMASASANRACPVAHPAAAGVGRSPAHAPGPHAVPCRRTTDAGTHRRIPSDRPAATPGPPAAPGCASGRAPAVRAPRCCAGCARAAQPCAHCKYQPRPDLTPIISATTSTENDAPSPMNRPTNTDGIAAGTATRSTRKRCEAPIVRATS
jgi:hypothetical protein